MKDGFGEISTRFPMDGFKAQAWEIDWKRVIT